MDVLSLVKKIERNDPGRDWYEVDPDVMYPAMLKEKGVAHLPDGVARAAILESARLQFTELLHKQNGRPIGIRILRREQWRL